MEVTFENNGLEIVGLMVGGFIVIATGILFYFRVIKGRSADLSKRKDGKIVK